MTMKKVPESQIEQSVLDGSYSFAPGTKINVVNPNGQTVSIDSDEAKDAFEQGYKFETSFQGAVREAADKYSGLEKNIAAFAGQASDEFAMGIPEMGYDKLADPFSVAVKDRIKKDAQISNDIGGVAGFGASLLYGGPVAKILGAGAKAGSVAEKIVASNLAKVGVTRGAQSIAKDVLARSAANATKLGIEGAIAAAPIAGAEASFETIDAITEDRIPNYKAAAEALAIGGGIGMGLGVLSGPLGSLTSRLGGKLKKSISGVGENVPRGTIDVPNPENPGDGTLLGTAQANGADDTILKTVSKELNRLKPNAKEITDASDRLMIGDVLEEQLSDSDAVQRLSSSLRKSPTTSGISRQNRLQKIYGSLRDSLQSAFGVQNFEKSVFEAGTQAKQSLIKKAQSAIDKEAEMFQALKMDYGQIQVGPKLMNKAVGQLQAIGETAIDEDTIALARRISGRLSEGRVATLDDVKQLRTNLYDLIGPNKAKNKAVYAVVDELNTIEDNTINNAIKSRIKGASVPGAATFEDAMHLQGMYDEMKIAKKNWAELASDLGETADDLNLGRIKSPRDFVEKMQGTDAEEIVKKFIPKADIKSARRLASKFPEEFESIANIRKAKMIDSAKSSVDGQIGLNSLLKQWNSLEPEMKELLIAKDKHWILKDIDTVAKSLPKDMNPSGTASALEWGKFLSPGQLLNEGSDLLKSEVIRKSVPIDGLIATENQMSFVSKQIDRIYDVLNGLEKSRPKSDDIKKSISAINQIFNNDRDDRNAQFQHMQAKLSDAAANPVSVANWLSEKLSPISETGAPKTSYALGDQIANSMAYLYKAMPKSPVTGNGFYNPKWNPSRSELSSFERKLSVVNDPFIVMDALADGTLTTDHMDALVSNYPYIYQAIRKRVIDHIAENPMSFSYQNRLKLSLLMGIDADPSVAGDNIKGFQDAFAPMPSVNTSSGLRSTGLDKIDLDEDFETESQRMMKKRKA